jgi:TonB family protein
LVKGSSIGTVTDATGSFNLSTNESNPVLIVSFIGYQSKRIDPQGQNSLVVKLDNDLTQLSEIVVTVVGAAKDDDSRPVVHLAEPVGGKKSYNKYLDTNVRYPKEALKNNVKGRVRVEFEVHSDGSFDQYKVVKSLGYGCDEEVIRLIKEGPKWSPSTEDGRPIESTVRIGVKFDPAKTGR